MKPLYYLEFAQSIKNDNIIPAKDMRWKVVPAFKTAWEDPCLCMADRVDMQKHLTGWIVRMKKASWLKNICIRLNEINGSYNPSDWVIVKESK